jgi:osmotically-inducible protein OsmY
MQDKETVILNGTVTSTAQQRKAVQLAQDTVGVEKVIDKTKIAKPQ